MRLILDTLGAVVLAAVGFAEGNRDGASDGMGVGLKDGSGVG